MALEGETSGKIWVPEVYSVGPQAVLYPQVGKPLLDPAQAAAAVLAKYLSCLKFVRWGRDAPDTVFQLQAVFDDWPEPDVDLPYPCASVNESGPVVMGASNLVPHALEETHNLFGESTVLWKLDEVDISFQVDFFTTDVPTRDAIAARLPNAFQPGEDGGRIVLVGNSLYYNRPVRATLVSYERVDNPDSVYARERRLRAMIDCSIDVVDLRCVSLLSQQETYVIGEDVVPVPEQPAPPLPVEEP
jgi:hypothetical protein